MNRFHVEPTFIEGTNVVTRTRFGDARGYLERVFCPDELAAAGWQGAVMQVNRALTRKRGTVRGLHYQTPPFAEYKLVTCLHGRVWDVSLDLRSGSPTFLSWFGIELSKRNRRALLIPPGCAHGFQTLTDDCELLYVHSQAFQPSADRGVNPRDPHVDIDWPQPISLLSARDGGFAFIGEDFEGVAP